MRAVRFLTFAVLLVVGLAGTAMAQGYNNTPGVYNDVKVGVVPAMLPPGSLPADIGTIGPDIYIGTLTITGGPGGFTATYQGERFHGEVTDTDGAKLNVSASFNGNWRGVLISPLLVGSSVEPIITGIDGANLLSANINGVGTVDGANRRVIARFGPGPTLANFKVLKAPGFLR